MVHAFSYTNQKMKKLILSMTLAAFTLLGRAYDFEADGFYYNILSLTDLTAEVTCMGSDGDYSNDGIATYSGDVVIPETVEYSGRTFSVTEIHPYAFRNCQIGTLTIHENIMNVYSTKEGFNAGIGGLAGRFEHLVIEDGDMPIQCFRGLIDGDVTESVYLGRNIDGEQYTNIVYGGGSFKEITFGEKVTFLEDVCSSCLNLTNVTIPANVKSLSSSFEYCENLKSVTAPGVESIDFAFANSGIETINMPNLKVIRGAFSGCQSLKSIEIPLGVVLIDDSGRGPSPFEYCVNLESIVFPSTLTVLDTYEGFIGCTSLNDITISNPTPIAIEESNFDAMTYLNATLRVPKGALEVYKNAPVWKNFFNIVEDENIQSNVFTVAQTDYCYGGEVSLSLSEEAFPAYGNYMFAEKGSELTIDLIPDEGYKFTKLVINNVNVTSEVVENQYKTIVNGGISIDTIKFEYVEPEPAMLTIKHADNGCIKQQVYYWMSYYFIIEAAEGWKIHTVTFNNEDVTSYLDEDGGLELYEITNDAILSIAFESDGSSAKAIDSSRAKIYGADNSIVIYGANDGEDIQIYDDAGLSIETVKATSNSMRIPLASGIYIVKLEGKTVKVAI